ncbi:hypothetical protein MHK_003389, partial [Candidatus Magnetomorum sp. HK-1]
EDLTGNGYDGIVTNMSDSDWITSGAAIGDDSVYDYSGSTASDYSVSIAHAGGDQFTATGDSGSYTGIHVYLVNESPNTISIPNGYTSMDTDHYYGIFPVGISTTYSITYNYNGNSYANDDTDLQIAYRTNNAGRWTGFASTQYTSTTTLTKTGIAAFSGISATEFTLGKNEAPVIDTEVEIVSFGLSVRHSFALKDDGTVWAVGENNYGKLGDGTTTNQSNPIQIFGLGNVARIEAGENHSIVIKDDGTVWTWGQNTYCELGDGTTTSRTTPVQVLNLNNITMVTSRAHHNIALKND